MNHECEIKRTKEQSVVGIVSDNPINLGIGNNIIRMFGVIVTFKVDKIIEFVLIERVEELVEL